MSQIAWLGYASIVAAFLMTALALSTALISALSGHRRYRMASHYATYLTFALYTVASTAIIHAFIHRDYALRYVYEYSDSTMPWFYQLAAFWGGQAGSLMFWTATLAAFNAAVVFFHKKRDPELLPWVLIVLNGTLLFFAMLLVFVSNPFEAFSIIDPPTEGTGLNPQLQTLVMLLHPPALIAGYVATTIPFAFAMAALLSGKLDAQWLKSTRKWTLIAWLALTIGLLLGMVWAYTELGWGGYWAWDPVENAALIPWLVMTAFIHSVIIQERRGMLKRWNMVLIILSWLLTIFGTYLTRSGLIVSVHSFAKSSIGAYFEGFMIFATAFSISILMWRWKELEGDHMIESPLSREAAFLTNNWILLGSAFVVFWGTIFPKVKEMLTGNPHLFQNPFLDHYALWITLGLSFILAFATYLFWKDVQTWVRTTLLALSLSSISAWIYIGSNKLFDGTPVTIAGAWFNTWMTPLGLSMLLLMGFGTMISWRRATWKNFKRNFFWPLIASAIATLLGSLGYYFFRLKALGVPIPLKHAIYVIIAFFASVFVISTTLMEFWRGTRVRMRKLQVGWLVALTGLVVRNQRRYGGYIVHLGVVMLFIGFSGDAFRIDAHLSMSPEQPVALGDYQVVFHQLDQAKDPDKLKIFAKISLYKDHKKIQDLTPGRYIYDTQPNMPTTEVDVRSTPLEDVYFALVDMEELSNGQEFVTLMMVINPFVFWIWFGGVFMVFGTLLALWPQTQWVLALDKNTSSHTINPPLKVDLPKSSQISTVSLWLVLGLAALMGLTPLRAQEDPPPVASVQVQDQVSKELYQLIKCQCTGCAGKAIADCHPGCGPGLRDRATIQRMLAAGKTKEEIIQYFISQRGEGAIMVPINHGFNQLAWIIPLLILIFTVPLIAWLIWKWHRKLEHQVHAQEEEANLKNWSDEDEKRLSNALDAME